MRYVGQPGCWALAEASQKQASLASQITDESALDGEIPALRQPCPLVDRSDRADNFPDSGGGAGLIKS